MKRLLIVIVATGVLALGLAFAILVVGSRFFGRDADPPAAASPENRFPTEPGPETEPAAGSTEGFLYGRVTTYDGATYRGRLRWGGGDEEAFWNDAFNGVKAQNPWASHVPTDELPRTRGRSMKIFGLEIGGGEEPADLGRPFMVRFGDLTRIEAAPGTVLVTLKSGATFELDRLDASDVDDGVRVWDETRGVVDVESMRIRTVDFVPTPPLADAPRRLYGTVRARQGRFTGYIQWNRRARVGSDELHGRTDEGEIALRFEEIHSIERQRSDGTEVTMQDGRRVLLAAGRELTTGGWRETGPGSRGISVDDPRYGLVTVSWDDFERVDFSVAGSGPGYEDFAPGLPLVGAVTTRDGRSLAGRIVYDLDESETIETLDAPSGGLDYTIPFGVIASIAPPGGEERGSGQVEVTLHGGEVLRLESRGDLGENNGGLLVFGKDGEPPEYVAWSDVRRIDLESPPAVLPLLQ